MRGVRLPVNLDQRVRDAADADAAGVKASTLIRERSMLSTVRSRIRALAVVGMAAVTGAVGGVTHAASAAKVAPPAAPATAGSGAHASSFLSIPDVIKPPAGSQPIGAYLVVSGTQTYTCVVPEGATAGAYTDASVPEALLFGTGGIVHHFAGPSWQSTHDGSLVTATKIASSNRSGTIPELLLKVTTRSGTGVLSEADYINRLMTSGGVAPTGPCTASETAEVQVPYSATYVFWDAPTA
ncbi:hypothetical protein GCM10010429_19860 [Micromonospora olivasterospora]